MDPVVAGGRGPRAAVRRQAILSTAVTLKVEDAGKSAG